MKAIKNLFMLLAVFAIFGCASTITSKPGGDSGIPYYLPKPYLLIAKNICFPQTKTVNETIKKDKEETIKTTVEPLNSCTQTDKVKDFFSFQVIFLPDLTQKYGIEIMSRTGTIDTAFTLVDGWKLTGLNLKADAKTSETIQAIGSVISQLPIKALPEKELQKLTKEAEAGLWLYEIRVEKGRIKYDLVIEWKH